MLLNSNFSGEKILELVPAGCFGLLLVEGFSSFFFVCTAIIVSKFSRNGGKRKPNSSHFSSDMIQKLYYVLYYTSLNGE